jgi:hypothetical protein
MTFNEKIKRNTVDLVRSILIIEDQRRLDLLTIKQFNDDGGNMIKDFNKEIIDLVRELIPAKRRIVGEGNIYSTGWNDHFKSTVGNLEAKE